jgi:hypothetical protein
MFNKPKGSANVFNIMCLWGHANINLALLFILATVKRLEHDKCTSHAINSCTSHDTLKMPIPTYCAFTLSISLIPFCNQWWMKS